MAAAPDISWIERFLPKFRCPDTHQPLRWATPEECARAGILGDKSSNGGNVLTRGVLAKLPKYDGQKVIYCAGCLIGKERQNAELLVIH